VASVLVGIWILLWGELSVANVLAGSVVAAALVRAVPRDGPERAVVVRPVELVRLVTYVLRQMIVSNALLIRAVLSRQSATCTGVIAVPMPSCGPQVVTVVAGLMVLSPGSMPVEAESDSSVLYVHILDLRDIPAVQQDLLRLRDLTIRALGSPAAVSAIEAGR
jgi:multicomponent Na+:H+ antiporter subunit E